MLLGDIHGQDEVLCRVHSSCIYGHFFNSLECDCREQMEVSQQIIQKEGRGILILMDQEGKGNGHYALLQSIAYKRTGMKQGDAYEAAGFKREARDFSAAAKILTALGVQSVRLLTNNPEKVDSLVDFGIPVVGTVEINLE